MPRPATGLNTVSRRRPDGTTDYTWYHRASGLLIGKSRDGWTKSKAQERAAELDAERGKAKPASGTFGELCMLYFSSPKFENLASHTKKQYRSHISIMLEMWAAVPVHGITRKVVRTLHASYADRRWTGNAIVRTLRMLMNFALHDVEVPGLAKNPAERQPFYETLPRDQIWHEWQIEAFLAAAADQPKLRLAFTLLLYTVQRPSDVLSFTLPMLFHWDGRTWIRLRQEKTGALVDVPCHARLEQELANASNALPTKGKKAALQKASKLLVPSPLGLTWQYRGFERSWDQVRRKANWTIAREAVRATGGLPSHRDEKARDEAKAAIRARMLSGLQRRDLRRTGMVQLAMAGATTPQISALSGHSIDRTQKILDTYLPRRGEVALGGVERWESSARSNVVPLTRRR